jgi:hypothetical protein
MIRKKLPTDLRDLIDAAVADGKVITIIPAGLSAEIEPAAGPGHWRDQRIGQYRATVRRWRFVRADAKHGRTVVQDGGSAAESGFYLTDGAENTDAPLRGATGGVRG